VAGAKTIVFFPEGAFGPTNNCVGIGNVLKERGHRVVFVVEESFAGTLEAKGFEEATMRLAPPPEEPEVPANSGRTSSGRPRRSSASPRSSSSHRSWSRRGKR
jgi:UDP:flavonoid glycosyltransferase YjiC (YdhE family)